MASNPIATILANIETLVDGVSTIKQRITGRSLDHATGYPVALIYLADISTQLLDTNKTHKRDWAFNVEIVQEITAKAKAQAEIDFLKAIEGLLDALRLDWTLSDAASFALVSTGLAQVEDTGGGIHRSAIIRLEITSFEG